MAARYKCGKRLQKQKNSHYTIIVKYSRHPNEWCFDMSRKRSEDLWSKYYAEKTAKKIRDAGFKGEMPAKSKLESFGKEITKIKKSPKENNSIERKVIIEQISRYNWRNHENWSMEKLIEIRSVLTDYFRIFKDSYDYECDILPKIIKKYEIEDLKIIVEDFEKRVSEKKGLKQIHDTEWEEDIISIKKIKRKEIQQQISPWITTDVDRIPFEDLEPLLYTIESIKKHGEIPEVSGLDDAKLILVNCEIKEQGGTTQKNISDARKTLECLESRKIIEREFPELTLPDDCKEVMRIYSEKIVPKDYPQDTKFTQKWVEKELEMLENNRGSVDLQALPKSTLI